MDKRGSVLLILLLAIVVVLAVAGIWYYEAHKGNTPIPTPEAQSSNNSVTTESPTAAQAIQALNIIDPNGTDTLLATTPTTRTLAPIMPTSSTNLQTAFGVTLVAPWSDVSSTKSTTGIFGIWFKNGAEIFILNDGKDLASSTANITAESSSITTDYDFQSAAFAATPGELIASTPADQAVLIYQLLLMKYSFLTGDSGPLYSFSINEIKGFQLGTMGSGLQKVTDLTFFDQNDDHYTMGISGTQGEVDYVLNSIQIK